VNNRGGLGGVTDEDGINLITVKGAAKNGADTFTDSDYHLNGQGVYASGAYVYSLRHRKKEG